MKSDRYYKFNLDYTDRFILFMGFVFNIFYEWIEVSMRIVPEKYRVKSGIWKTNEGDSFGLFFVSYKTNKTPLKVIAAPSDSEWQHVSISLPNRCPTHEEMSFIKDLFWTKDDTVVHFFPKKDEYVNNHRFCLHLWRHSNGHQLPPSILTGIK